MLHRHLPALSARDLAVLAIEREWGSSSMAVPVKLARARSVLGLSPEAYALVVAGLLNDPAAEIADPETVGRLRLMRSNRGC